MFEKIPQEIIDRMRFLEDIDARDRIDGTPRMKRVRQIPPETGKFLALLAASAPQGDIIEIGTSAGYSTLWLALACRATKRKITTFEILEDKAEMAEETFRLAKVENEVEFIFGDALDYIVNYNKIAFCFLDAEKEVYDACYEMVVPNMVSGGILVVDNIISHKSELDQFIKKVEADTRVDSVIVPIGKGEFLCRRR